MQWFSERFKILVPLAAGVYLGFYGYGLVLSVFDPFDRIGMTLIAGLCLAIIAAYMIARRHGISPFAPDSPLARSERTERERRGF